MQIKPLIKNCFIERVQKSNNIFGKFPLGGKTHHNREGNDLKKEKKYQNGAQKSKVLIPGKIFNSLKQGQILGVSQHYPP